MLKKKNSGITMGIAMIMAVAIMIIIFAMARTIEFNSHVRVYFDSMYRTYRLAETRNNEVIGLIASKGSTIINTKEITEKTFTDQNGKTKTTVAPVTYYTYPSGVRTAVNGYYIVTESERTVGSHKYTSRLHTYAAISNISDYFDAINGTLNIGACDISKGKVYARVLNFVGDPQDPSKKTRVLRAEYVQSPDPVNMPTLSPERPLWDSDPAIKQNIIISDPADGKPVELINPLLFPQVLDSDLNYYKSLAKAHLKCDFRLSPRVPDNALHIFPPGYGATQDGTDDYDSSKHTSDEADHVYYCDDSLGTNGNMYIEGTIHGQVLFVATGDIYLTKDVVSYPDTNNIPGGSKAHQAVFITRKNIYIEPINPIPSQAVKIQGLFYAPQGTLKARPYASSAIHSNLKLDFTGSLVLLTSPDLAAVFMKERNYAYMESLKNFPPPYLPALSQIDYAFEETVGGGMF